MDAPTEESYRDSAKSTLVIYEIRIPGAAERLHSERAAWGESGDIEALDRDHFVPIVQTGGARRLAP